MIIGYWIENQLEWLPYKCSSCCESSREAYRYCPNCGCCMKGEMV